MMEECDDKDNGMMAYVRYRLEKAQEVYEAANVLYMASQWNSVINRLYYACFYSATALLLYKKISAKSHSGVIGQFSEQIVRTGLVSIEEFRVYAKLLNWRSKGDYNDLFDFTKEDVDSMMNPTKHFIDKVAGLIELP
ncbi:MAG: HEPN domain-containing protein [Parabacteroides sp.]|nr:HEPN domain-containing protein [Parabacteroides sp.]